MRPDVHYLFYFFQFLSDPHLPPPVQIKCRCHRLRMARSRLQPHFLVPLLMPSPVFVPGDANSMHPLEMENKRLAEIERLRSPQTQSPVVQSSPSPAAQLV